MRHSSPQQTPSVKVLTILALVVMHPQIAGTIPHSTIQSKVTTQISQLANQPY
jgi:hypothetical protein